jgi:hypothetical protein
MNPPSQPRDEDVGAQRPAEPGADRATTPATDLQGQDAGTASSGTGRRATAAQSVMKQEQKTEHERGRRR